MEFPADVLVHIRAYSQPMTRPDWRDCNKRISDIILGFAWDTVRWFERLYLTRPELHLMVPGLYQRVHTWTLYQRILLMKKLIAIN